MDVFASASGMPSKKPSHVADVRDRHADLADLALGKLVVGRRSRSGRQVEGHRKPGLALREIAPVELVRRRPPNECPA